MVRFECYYLMLKLIILVERIISETAKLDKLETEENAKQLAILRNLVGLNESLRAQEALFKGNCKKQLLHLQGLIGDLEKEGYGFLSLFYDQFIDNHTAKFLPRIPSAGNWLQKLLEQINLKQKRSFNCATKRTETLLFWNAKLMRFPHVRN